MRKLLVIVAIAGLCQASVVQARSSAIGQPLESVSQQTLKSVFALSQGFPTNLDMGSNDYSFIATYTSPGYAVEIQASPWCDFIKQAILFINDPYTFSQYFPCMHVYFVYFAYDLISPYFLYSSDVYVQLAYDLINSQYGSYFYNVSSYSYCCWIDYYYNYAVRGWDFTEIYGDYLGLEDFLIVTKPTADPSKGANRSDDQIPPDNSNSGNNVWYGYFNGVYCKITSTYEPYNSYTQTTKGTHTCVDAKTGAYVGQYYTND